MLDIGVGTFLLVGAAFVYHLSVLARRSGKRPAWPPGMRWLTIVYCIQGPAMIWRGWTGRAVPFETAIFVVENILFAFMLIEMVIAYRRWSASRRLAGATNMGRDETTE